MSAKDRWIIPLLEIPDNMAIHEYIFKKTDLNLQIEKFSKFKMDSYRREKNHFDIQKLEVSVADGISKFGLHQFKYGNTSLSDTSPYVSSSLTWNPAAHDKISPDPHLATLGSSAFSGNSASFYTDEKKEIAAFRNSYHDTYSFVERTPFSCHLFIKEFLDSFQRTLVRSRISTMKAGREETTKFDFCWHNDEQVFLNLRINIPIQTSSSYTIQIIKNANDLELEIDEFSMEKGYAYVYDSGKNHRPFCKKLDTADRIHMICGVSPWFDFDIINQCWRSNEYFGEIHPFEMFSQGLISPYIYK